MNKYQKFLNKKALQLFVECYPEITYRQARYDWNYCLQNIGHYKIMLVNIGIKRKG